MINLGLDPTKQAAPTAEVVPIVTPIAPPIPVAPGGISPVPPVVPGTEEVNVFDKLTRAIEEENA